MLLMPSAAHVIQFLRQRVEIPQGELTPKTRHQFGLQVATRLHEVEMCTNRLCHTTVSSFQSPVYTACHTMGDDHAQNCYVRYKEGMPKAGLVTRVKSKQHSLVEGAAGSFLGRANAC